MQAKIIRTPNGYTLSAFPAHLRTVKNTIDELLQTAKKQAQNIGFDFFYNAKNQTVFFIESKEKFLNRFLLPNQVDHTKKLISSIQKHNAGLDISQTGSGKTFSAVAVAKILQKKMVVITTVSNSEKWRLVAQRAKVPCHATTYEKIRSKKNKIVKQDGKFVWNLDNQKYLIVYDEAHKTVNQNTINQKIMVAGILQKIPMLILSATMADNPFEFRALGLALGIYSNTQDYNNWLRQHKANPENQETKKWSIPKEEKKQEIKKIRNFLFSTGRVSEIPISYQTKNNIVPVLVEAHPPEFLRPRILELQQEIANHTDEFTSTIKKRQLAELLKIAFIARQAIKDYKQRKSVIIFLNFLESINILSQVLKTKSIIIGEMNKKERTIIMRAFQSGQNRILLCSDAAIEGIDLDDQKGDRPRETYISPRWSGKKLKQTLGRAVRTTTKSNTTQNIIFLKDTIEEKVYSRMTERAELLSTLSEEQWEDMLCV